MVEVGAEVLLLQLVSSLTILTEPLTLLFVFVEVALKVTVEIGDSENSLFVVVSFFDYLLLLIWWWIALLFLGGLLVLATL